MNFVFAQKNCSSHLFIEAYEGRNGGNILPIFFFAQISQSLEVI